MNNITKGNAQNRRIFGELFFSSQKNLQSKFLELKRNFSCKKCYKCCHNRYIELSPDDIKELAKEEKSWANFLDFFNESIPDADFEKKVKQNNNKVWFYSCKYFDGKTCTYEGQKQSFCQGDGINFEKVLPIGCNYTNWQKAILQQIEKEIFKDILIKYKQINAYKDNFSCNKSGTCCKFACSEFSYEELQQKAKNNDNFATQFVSIFIPYEDQEEAKKIYPEYVEMLEEKLGKDEKVYFYHCPHLDENNLCTQYEKRPDICRDFPNNPLSVLPDWCGYCQWKEETEILAMTLHALVNIGEFYKEKLENVI